MTAQVRTANDTAMRRIAERLAPVCKCGARISRVAGVWIHSETPAEACFFASKKE